METVGEVIPPEERQKFLDISKVMSRTLRRAIMDDTGNSNLRRKVLDVITNLRLEAPIVVNEEVKTKRTFVRQTSP